MTIVFEDLPGKCGGWSRANEDGSHTIILNSRLNWARQREAFLHELEHIQGDDWLLEEQADLIEQIRRQ